MARKRRKETRKESARDRQSASLPEKPLTPRGATRADEEERFASVIVKRTDEARRHPDDILQYAIEGGLEQLNRPAMSLLLSAVVAGLILGFTAMSVAVMTTLCRDLGWEHLTRLATAIVYPTGFVICMMSGTELFTEHTATAVYPVLDRRASPLQMIRLWVLVAIGNLVGAGLGASLLLVAEGAVGARFGYIQIGRGLVGVPAGTLLASAVLAGSLMALGAWLILSTPPTVSQLASIYVVTFTIGFGDLHHSIAGSVEAFSALLMDPQIGLIPVARFVGLALAGNLVGGSVLVAVLNYSHIRRSRTIQED